MLLALLCRHFLNEDRTMHRMKFHRSSNLAFPKTAQYGACIEKPMPRSPLASPSFYIGGLMSLVIWTLIWMFVAFLLEMIR